MNTNLAITRYVRLGQQSRQMQEVQTGGEPWPEGSAPHTEETMISTCIGDDMEGAANVYRLKQRCEYIIVAELLEDEHSHRAVSAMNALKEVSTHN